MSAVIDRPFKSDVLQEGYRTGGYVKVHEVTPKTVAVDVACGLFAPLIVSPFIAIVDASIIMSVNGDKTPVMKGLAKGYKTLLSSPHKFFGSPFWRRMCVLCWMVYGGTYAATNLAVSYNESKRYTDAEGKYLKLSAAGGANIGLTIIKDMLMVKIIAEYAPAQSDKEAEAVKTRRGHLPLRSRGCIFIRDGLTMFAAFYFADKFGKLVHQYYGDGKWEQRTSRQIANLVLPVALQPVSTVFHLYALNYARDTSQSSSSMKDAIKANYAVSTTARMLRILPAVGIGNNINNELRDLAYRHFERRRII